MELENEGLSSRIIFLLHIAFLFYLLTCAFRFALRSKKKKNGKSSQISSKEKIERMFRFSYDRDSAFFSPEENGLTKLTLLNTYKNVKVQAPPFARSKPKKDPKAKSVKFKLEGNVYYDDVTTPNTQREKYAGSFSDATPASWPVLEEANAEDIISD